MTRKTSGRSALVAPSSDGKAFQGALLAGTGPNAAGCPGGEEPSAYRTVVSEFMLQQTQVATVLPYFERWMAAYPDFAALAAAPESAVLRLWEGLGYYARARNLHRLAQSLGRAGRLPRTAAGWQEHPGIGPYTAAADREHRLRRGAGLRRRQRGPDPDPADARRHPVPGRRLGLEGPRARSPRNS
jgi:adenine-specific DNA glycosylase